MRRIAGPAAALCLVVASADGAGSIRSELEVFGFFGQWALHCDQPASPTNSRRSVAVTSGGDVIFTESLGLEYPPNVYLVRAVNRTAPNSAVLRIELNGQVEQDLTMVREGGQLRTVTNRRVADGELVVKDGIIASNGEKTPWLTRCAEQP